MKRFIAFLIGMTLSAAALADVKTVSFTNATKNTDGTTIAATGPGSLARSAIEYGTCNTGKTAISTKVGEVTLVPPANSTQVSLVVVQEYCLDAYHSNTFATTFGPGLPGNSAVSNVVVTQSNPPTPNPPGGLVVGNFVAYQIAQGPGQLTALAFGHVPEGTSCDMTQTFDDGIHGPLHVIPDWQSVIMPDGSHNTTRQTVLAACG